MQAVQLADCPFPVRNRSGCDVILLSPSVKRNDGVPPDAVLEDLEPQAPDIVQTSGAAAQESDGGIAGLQCRNGSGQTLFRRMLIALVNAATEGT